jgi:cytochrome o ubiquinol oxidase operon protein cyoD
MSAQHATAGHAAGHDDHHEHDDLHVTMSDYVKGFILAVILTVIPFYLVMNNVIQDRTTAVLVLGGFAIVQILVHMVYFLHMNGKIQGGWTMLSTIFTVVFLSIAIAGTLWVMFHMNNNMMPDHPASPAALLSSTPDAGGNTTPAPHGAAGHATTP